MIDKKFAVAVVAPQEPFEFFGDFWEGVWSAAYELAPLGVQVQSILLESPDAERQAQALEELLRADVNAVVLLPADSQRLDVLIDRHAQNGTPVVTVSNDAPLSGRAVFVGPDYQVTGRLAGEMLRNVLQSDSRIATLAGPPTSARVQQYKGFQEALRENSPAFEISEFESGAALLDAMSGTGLPFDGVYLGWSECVQLRPILARMVSPARAIAFGMTPITTPYLQSGILCAVIDSSLYYQGYLAVQKAYECANAQLTESRWIAIPSSVMLSAHASGKGQNTSTHLVMEAVLRQRTRQLHTYKEELGRANARLMSEVETDSLTGLLNRRRFEEILEDAAAARTDSDAPVTVLMVAMDDISEIEELLGKTARDQAVQAVAGALQKACTSDAVVARTGVGEFAVLSYETTAILAQGLTERILHSIAEARTASDPDCTFTVSVRLTCPPLHGRTELKRPAAKVSLSQLRRAG